MRFFLPGLMILCGLWLPAANAQTADQSLRFVGAKTCASCHVEAYEAWHDSHHSWAWRAPEPKNVLGDFDASKFEHNGITSRFSRRGDDFFVSTDGPDGKSTEYQITHTVGVAPLQQYLVEIEPGRLQALDTAWDVERQRWYHLYADQDLNAGDGLHWTGPYKNWNGRCAECHATGFEKNFGPQTRRFASTQAEIGVTCEACHGPGEAHVAWASNQDEFDPPQWGDRVDSLGLISSTLTDTAEAEIQGCAGCHARREPLSDASPLAQEPFADNYRLALLRENLYHADGLALDEAYVYGSFLQAKMYDRGVSCSNCHEPHSGGLVAEGNAVCTQCHSPAGNDQFATLIPGLFDAPEHHFHEQGSTGAQCVSCHMPERFFMVVDGRRDHRFSVPRPDLSVATGTPNACTDCHTEQSSVWAADAVAEWYPEGRSGSPHFASLFTQARQRLTQSTQRQLMAFAEEQDNPPLLRATALDHLRQQPSRETADAAARFLRDDDPNVRAAAIVLQRPLPASERIRRLLSALQDEMRAVRIEAMRSLLDTLGEPVAEDVGQAIRSAAIEYQQSLMAKADFPEIQMALGGTALTLRNLPAAEGAFAEAVRMDPQLALGWVALARVQLQRGDELTAQESLRRGVAAAPNDGTLHRMLGSSLAGQGKLEEARPLLERAYELTPDDAATLAVLGNLLSDVGDDARAVELLSQAVTRGAGSPEIVLGLLRSQLAIGDISAAERNLIRLELTYPRSPQATVGRELFERERK